MIRLPEPLLDWTSIVGCYVLPSAAFHPHVVGAPRIVTRVSGKRLYVRRLGSDGTVRPEKTSDPDEFIMSKSVEVICDTWDEVQKVRDINTLADDLERKRRDQLNADVAVLRQRLMAITTPEEA